MKERHQINEKNKMEERYTNLVRIEKIGPELYRIEELDDEKGYRVSTINSKTEKTVLEKRF